MKKFIVASVCLFSAFVFLSSTSLEARRYTRSNNVSFAFGQQTVSRDVVVVQQYSQPSVVYIPQQQYYAPAPGYYAPVYVPQPAPVYYTAPAPVYVEQVYVSRPRPSFFSGFSFSFGSRR